MIANLMETNTLESSSELDTELVNHMVVSHFLDNAIPDDSLSEEEQQAPCIRLMRRTENESRIK